MSGGTRRVNSKRRTTSASRSRKTAAARQRPRQSPVKATAETGAGKRKAKSAETIVKKVEVPGARAALFKLVERALESYFLFRSSRKIGTARVEPNGYWTARFDDVDGSWIASSKSSMDLLRLIGEFQLAKDARRSASRRVEEANPALDIKGKKTVEERLSIAFAERARTGRIEELDRLLNELRTKIKPA
jgi:hypothetical protein